MELISKEGALKVFGDIHPLDHNANAYKAKIEQLPIIESRAEGEWIIKPMETICGKCNMSFSTEIHYLNWEMGDPNYCPNCGAYIRGQIDALKIGVDKE